MGQQEGEPRRAGPIAETLAEQWSAEDERSRSQRLRLRTPCYVECWTFLERILKRQLLKQPRVESTGAGYVGSATGPSLSRLGHRVVDVARDEGYDVLFEEAATGASGR